MSTPCKIQIGDSFPVSRCLHEIEWLQNEAEKVREQMKKRPSKIRHLRDIERQIRDHEEILKRYHES